MFGPPGVAYVYFIYGMHFMFNAVTERDGRAGAVLIRALEPLEGIGLMVKRRGTSDKKLLASGPARLCQALGITLEHNGLELWRGPLGIWEGRSYQDGEVRTTPRVGVAGSMEEPYRFVVKNSPHISTFRSKRR